jgi:hypothetical protein
MLEKMHVIYIYIYKHDLQISLFIWLHLRSPHRLLKCFPLTRFVFPQPLQPDPSRLACPWWLFSSGWFTYPGVAYLPWSGRQPPMRVLLLGTRALFSAVWVYFSGFVEPNRAMKFLPTPESFVGSEI